MSNSAVNGNASYRDMFSRMQKRDGSTAESGSAEERSIDHGYSEGVREVSKSGFERYNLRDSSDVYIGTIDNSVLTNDGNPTIVKAESDVIVGQFKPQPAIQVTRVEKSTSLRISPLDMFANVDRGSEHIVETQVGAYRNGMMINPKLASQMRF